MRDKVGAHEDEEIVVAKEAQRYAYRKMVEEQQQANQQKVKEQMATRDNVYGKGKKQRNKKNKPGAKRPQTLHKIA